MGGQLEEQKEDREERKDGLRGENEWNEECYLKWQAYRQRDAS